MAEKIDQSTLQLENVNLKREVERCKEELGKLRGEQEKTGKELRREISHSDTSQKLNDELSRRINELENSVSKSPVKETTLKEEMVEKMTKENSELKSKVSEQKEEIEKLTSQLGGTMKEQLEMDLQTAREDISELEKQKSEIESAKTQLNDEHENLVNKFVVLELDFGKLQKENRELNEQNKTLSLKTIPSIPESNMSLESQELERSFSEGVKPDIIGSQTPSEAERNEELNGERMEKLLIENNTLKDERKELNSEVDLHKRRISELEGKLVTMEINLAKSQAKDEELKKANKQYLAELNKNNELQMEINRTTEEYKANISNLNSEIATLKNQIGILQIEKGRWEDFQLSPGEQYKQNVPHEPCSDWTNLPPTNYQYQDPEIRPRRPDKAPPQPPPTFPPSKQDLQPPQMPNPSSMPQFRYEWSRKESDTSVNLIWYKEIPNLEREITYMDNSGALVKLEWVEKNAFFLGRAMLSCGEHSGSFVFPTSGEMQSIQTFQVKPGDETIGLKLKQTDSKI